MSRHRRTGNSPGRFDDPTGLRFFGDIIEGRVVVVVEGGNSALQREKAVLMSVGREERREVAAGGC